MNDTNSPVLVSMTGGTAVTTSLVISEGTDVEHRAVLQLVRNNLPDFEEFGGVAFEMRPFVTAGGTQERTVAVLSEPQATLLMTYMRNNAAVRDFKKRLVKAFYTLTHTPAPEPDEVVVHRALQITYRKVQELEAANAEMQPKASYFDEFVADEDLIQFRTLANQLGMQEKVLRDVLIGRKWIYRLTASRWSNKRGAVVSVNQYRAYADKKHLFRLVPCHEAPRVNGEVQQALKLTPAGAELVARAVRKWQLESEKGWEIAPTPDQAA